MPNSDSTTVGEALFRCYANLAMAHAAVADGSSRYGPKHYAIRSRLFRGLREGTMAVGSLIDDDRVKRESAENCCYCGSGGPLTADHLWPTASGGPDTADNVVWCCRPCNSSKGSRDLLVWYASRKLFPPLMLLRRYLKLAIGHAHAAGFLHRTPADVPDLPFSLDTLPSRFPAPQELRL